MRVAGLNSRGIAITDNFLEDRIQRNRRVERAEMMWIKTRDERTLRTSVLGELLFICPGALYPLDGTSAQRTAR
jgi:hypothetical protein